jgi:hypothetical protein
VAASVAGMVMTTVASTVRMRSDVSPQRDCPGVRGVRVFGLRYSLTVSLAIINQKFKEAQRDRLTGRDCCGADRGVLSDDWGP